MFDIGFSEIVLIAGLSLVVLGPKKLPGVVRTMGRWAGRARAMARQFRDQLEAEADNLKVDLNTQSAPGQSSAGTGERAAASPGAAAAAAAAPTPPAEFTGAPLAAPVSAPADATAQAEVATPAAPEFASANDSGHADLGAPAGADTTCASTSAPAADATPAHPAA
jgi:sec-independent protein translocase protein TatB